jgi:hypothetical protein
MQSKSRYIYQIPWFLKFLHIRHPHAFIASGSVNRFYLTYQLTKLANVSVNYFNIMYTHYINTMTSNGDIYNISPRRSPGHLFILIGLATNSSLHVFRYLQVKLVYFCLRRRHYLFGEYKHLAHSRLSEVCKANWRDRCKLCTKRHRNAWKL